MISILYFLRLMRLIYFTNKFYVHIKYLFFNNIQKNHLIFNIFFKFYSFMWKMYNMITSEKAD